MNTVINKNYTNLPFCEREILRYAGCKEECGEISALLSECITEAKSELTYKVCYCELPVKIIENFCDFGVMSAKSEKLSLNLKNCERVILFAATIGVGIDRLINKYGRISPSKAIMLQAIGAEQIEALCDRFCEDIKGEYNADLRPRFSPGYGDLPLLAQKDIFNLLEPERKIGLTLNSSLIMSPTKSVTAFVGICNKSDSSFRGVL